MVFLNVCENFQTNSWSLKFSYIFVWKSAIVFAPSITKIPLRSFEKNLETFQKTVSIDTKFHDSSKKFLKYRPNI